jgi:hypothetical protein
MTMSQLARMARQPVPADVAGHGADALGGHGREAVLAELVAQHVEGVVLEDLALDPLGDGGPLARTHEEHDGAVGHAAQQTFQQVGAEEPGRAGDEDALVGQRFTNHDEVSTIW